ncbi:hypothetical protein WJX82_000135 [Trebouxia sp. C0006]
MLATSQRETQVDLMQEDNPWCAPSISDTGLNKDYVTSRHGRALLPELHKHVSYEAYGMPQNSVQSTECQKTVPKRRAASQGHICG